MSARSSTSSTDRRWSFHFARAGKSNAWNDILRTGGNDGICRIEHRNLGFKKRQESNMEEYLNRIKSPADVKKLGMIELERLAEEIRAKYGVR